MTPEKLDFVFPFFVLTYGLMMTVVLNVPALQKLTDTRLSAELRQRMRGHRTLALLCLGIGGLWSIQNLWV